MSILALSFHDVNFNPVVQADNQIWLRAVELAEALGYADPSSVNRIYARNADEFSDGMTASVKLTDPKGELQESRIFSLRGCHLIAMFARTAIAKQFRKWVLDILDKENSQPTFDLTETLSQALNQISKGNKKLYMSMYNGLTRRFTVGRLADIPHTEIHNALATIYFFAVEWHRKNTPTQLPLKLNDGEHYLVVKDGVVLWEKKLKPHCNDIPSNTLKNPTLMLEHIREVVGEFVGKDALPAPKPTLDINYPAITARPRNSFLPNQHWYKASDFVSGNFDPVRDFLDKLEQADYEVTGLKIINNAKTWIIQQQDKAIKQIEKGYKHIADGLRLNNEFGMNVYGFTMGKVSY